MEPQHDSLDPVLTGLALPAPGAPGKLAGEAALARQAVASLLARARARARWLFAAQLAVLVLAAAGVAILGGAALAATGQGFAGRAALLALVVGLGGAAVFVVRSPLWRALRVRGDAGLARALSPQGDLGLELLSSVELASEPAQRFSADLVSLAHLRAASRAGAVDLARSLPTRWLRAPLGALALVLCAALGFALAAPRGLSLGLARLFSADGGANVQELAPIAGDLSITYLYPAYTGLPARTEEGTAGDLRAPKGTQVRLTARADRDLAHAFAVVNGAAQELAAQGAGHRLLSGTLTLEKAGEWRLRYTDGRGRTIAEGPSRPVEVIADQPPQVSLESVAEQGSKAGSNQRELEVDPLGKLDVAWSAQDDHGLSEVSLVFQLAGGKEERRLLKQPGSGVKKLRASLVWELAPLHLRAGDKVSYFIEAKDNDAVDGPQRGVSATQVIKVFSAAEHHRESLQRAQQLWERLVVLLADRLEEKTAPQKLDEDPTWYAGTSAKDRDALALAADMGRAARELAKDKLAPKAIWRAVKNVAAGVAEAAQRSSIQRAPLARGSAGREGALRLFSATHQAEIKELEKGVLYLADLLDRARLEDLAELGKELDASRRELARLAEKLRAAPDVETKQKVLAEVARLRERINDLMKRMGELAKGIRDVHLNEEAVSAMQKENDLLGQLDDIQKKLQSGKVEDALKQLDELGRQLDKLQKDLAQNAASAQDERYAQEAKELKEAAQELSQLEEKEKDLEQRTTQLRREAQAAAQKRFEQRGGKDLGKRLKEKVAQAQKALRGVDRKVAEGLGMDDRLEAAEGRTTDTGRALEMGELDEALDLARRALRATEEMKDRLSIEDQMAKRYPGFLRDPGGVERGLEATQRAQAPLQDVVSQLQNAMPQDGQGMTAEQMKRLRAQADEQKDLKGRLQGVREKLAQVGKKVPVFGPQHEQMLQEAQQGMGEAQDKLGRGEPRGAQSGEEQAIEKMGKFEEAMQKLAKGGKGGGGGLPMPWGDPSGEGEGDQEGEGDSTNHEKVEIPDAEASRAPQEFRKELLDAMKQQAPERYKERVRQYYEELVK